MIGRLRVHMQGIPNLADVCVPAFEMEADIRATTFSLWILASAVKSYSAGLSEKVFVPTY